jgi:hypothetical protein
MITREALRVLENNLTFTMLVRRDFDDNYGRAGAKIGTVLNIRKPPRYIGRIGQGLQIEDATETSVPLALNIQRGVDIAFTSQDLALSIDDFSDRFIKPAIANVANGVDFDGLSQYVNLFNIVGTPGTVPNQLLTYLNAGVDMDNMAAPIDGERSLVLNPQMQATIVDSLKGLFQSSEKISAQYVKGKMGETIGFKWHMDQNVRSQTIGAQGGTPTVTTTAGQTGSTINTTGWTINTNVLNKGDIVQFAGVYAVNPQNRTQVTMPNPGALTLGLANWVVTGAVTSDGSGNATIPIAGPSGNGIIISGPFQNASASPTASGTVYVVGTAGTVSPQGLAFHPDCFAMGCADLPLPGGVDMAARVNDHQLGMSLRMIRAYDINTDRFPTRLDILYGWTTLYPELGVRIAS